MQRYIPLLTEGRSDTTHMLPPSDAHDMRNARSAVLLSAVDGSQFEKIAVFQFFYLYRNLTEIWGTKLKFFIYYSPRAIP